MIGAAFLCAGCGIPQFPVLERPVLGAVTQLPALVPFAHDPRNNTDSFLGYELYYKFYDPDTAAAGGVQGEFEADRAAIENASPAGLPIAATSRRYHRVFTEDQAGGDPPALRIASALRGTPFQVTVTFPETSASIPDAVARWGGETRILVRDQNLLGNPPDPVGFGPGDFVPGTHADLPDSLSGGDVEMALMIVSYGVDFANGTFAPVYSPATVTNQLLRIIYE
jgi:hypothetical protein